MVYSHSPNPSFALLQSIRSVVMYDHNLARLPAPLRREVEWIDLRGEKEEQEDAVRERSEETGGRFQNSKRESITRSNKSSLYINISIAAVQLPLLITRDR